MPYAAFAPRARTATQPTQGGRAAAAVSASVGLGIALLFSTGTAAAAPDASAASATEAPRAAARHVWIDARPWTCIHEASALARDAELACDALGGHCQVATSEASATHRAILTCDPTGARWTLRIETAASETLVTVMLTGDHEERLRKAAMWIARVEDEGPAEGPPPDAAPPVRPRPLPSDAPNDTPGSDAGAAGSRSKPNQTSASRGGLALDATFGVTNSSFIDSFRGLHASILFAAGPFRVGPVGAYEQGFVSGSGFSNATQVARIGRVGARAGWGAPFDDHIIGLWIETGAAIGTRLDSSVLYDVPFDPKRNSTDFVTPYGRAEVILQLPFDAPVRPYLSVAGTHTMSEFGEGVQSAQASAGLAWRAW